MNKKLSLVLVLGGALMLSSCSKKLNPFAADYFTANPNPLEVVGDKIPATVTAKIPAKFFAKNAEVTVTPYLVYNGTETVAQPYTVQGEKVRGNNQVINYEYGGTVTIPVMYTYVPEMAQSDLQLAFNVVQGNKQYALPRVTVANGVVATATLADAGTVTPAIAPDKFQRIINEKYAAEIKFLVNQSNIRKGELTSDEMSALHAKIAEANDDENLEIAEVNISSYASPEGGLDFNTKLAEKREQSTSKYLKDKFKKDKITEFGELTAQFTAEDWEGFQRLVSQSDIQDKELILSVLSMYKDPEQREKEIRNLSSVFDQLADEILPQLRYSRITASINVIGKSDEEIAQIFELNPKALSVDEILYFATLTNDNEQKLNIYSTAAELYPEDYRTFNNLGVCQYIDQDFDAAKNNFEQAAKIAGDKAEPQLNLGLTSLLEKDYKNAGEKFGSAAGLNELNDAMGVYYMMQGDTKAALKNFGDSKSNNAALAQILNKDYSKAKSTLSAINNPDATTYYLMAVLGARTNNEQMVYSNLRQVSKLDKEMAQKALTDLEFAKFNLSSVLSL